MKKFSERIGITKPPVIQLDEITLEFRNSLWNIILMCLEGQTYRNNELGDLCKKLAFGFFKIPLDSGSLITQYTWFGRKEWIKEKFYKLQWYRVYELIEFLIQREKDFMDGNFQKRLNIIFERENSGYRLINNQIGPITNEQEIQTIEEATEKAAQFGMGGAREHLDTALSMLAQKPNPDYRNSIKESISAVESLAKLLSGKDSGGLEPSLKELSKKTPIHTALRDAFLKLYGYTSDEDGIRHAMLEDTNVGYDEAKFMLVSCSAFVNFLLSKAQKSGLLKKG